jgi:hypothetical protein
MMAITLKDGGPAYPHVIVGDLGQTREVHEGMSMRQWYAAHAPAVPEWFRLKDDGDWPKVPSVPDEWGPVERGEFSMIKDGSMLPAAACDDVQVFWRRYEPARVRAEAWRQEMRQKKFFAWRWFYADMMLETEP